MDNEKLWNDFKQSGSVESYLIYARSKGEDGKVTQDDGNRGTDNQVNQIR